MQFIGYKCLSVREFERECGISNGLVKNMEKGFGKKTQRKIFERFPELNPSWLLLGAGDMLQDITTQSAPNILSDTPNYTDEIQRLTAENDELKKQIEELKKQTAQQMDIILKLASK